MAELLIDCFQEEAVLTQFGDVLFRTAEANRQHSIQDFGQV